MNQETVKKSIDAIAAAIPTLIAVSVVEIESGMSLGSISNDPTFDPDIASAYNAEVVKQKKAAMNALGIGNQTVEDILITLSNQLHLIRLTSDGNHFIYMAAKKETNLAIARSALKQNNL